jgi:hypothetical protein
LLGSAVDIIEERSSVSLIGPLGGIGMGKSQVVLEFDFGSDLSVSSVDAVLELSSLISTRLVTI